MSQPDEIAREVVVHGRVQGVFFRDSCRQQAHDHGVRGWVRNEPDGSVRAHLEGDAGAVERVLAWMYDGPRHARVQQVQVTETAVTGARDFAVR